ncbi:MAG: hypothetical protein AMXMBFR58_11450 [Phycisphaerae bacterium]
MELVFSSPSEVVLAGTISGWRVLGESRFVCDYSECDEGLEAFARSIGAVRVLWCSYSMGPVPYHSSYRAPVTDTSKTTGTVTGPDGRAREVELTTTTERREERTVEGTRDRFQHSAAFLVRSRQ